MRNPDCPTCGKIMDTFGDGYWCPRCRMRYTKEGNGRYCPVSKEVDFLTTFITVRDCLEANFGTGRSKLSYFDMSFKEHLKDLYLSEFRKAVATFGSPETFDKFIVADSLVNQSLPFHHMIYCQPTHVTQLTDRVYPFGDDLVKETKTEYFSYPYSPVSSFVVAAVLGKRVRGEFVMTRGSGRFLANPAKDYSPTLLQSLNSLYLAHNTNAGVYSIADSARYLFSFEQDYFQDSMIRGWHVRRPGDRSGCQARWNVVQPMDWPLIERAYYDIYFLPTLLETEVFNFEKWEGYPVEKKPLDFSKAKEALKSVFSYSRQLQEFTDSGKRKYFFVGIAPYRDSTLIMINYPTMSIFGRASGLVSVDLQLGWLKWMINGIISLLSSQENIIEPTSVMKEEKHQYWSVLNQIRADKFPNLAHPVFESALKEIEKSEPESRPLVGQESSRAFQRKVNCYFCGAQNPYENNFCVKCGKRGLENVQLTTLAEDSTLEKVMDENLVTDWSEENIKKWIDTNVELANSDNFYAAIQHCNNALNTNPTLLASSIFWAFKASALYEFAISDIQQQNVCSRLEEALRCCDNALKINSENPLGWYVKASAEDKLGWTLEAINSFKKFLQFPLHTGTAEKIGGIMAKVFLTAHQRTLLGIGNASLDKLMNVARQRLRELEYISSSSPTCTSCGEPLTWAAQYQRWYCNKDRKYADVKTCIICGGVLTWIPQYRQWYCYKDQKYSNEIPQPSRPQEPRLSENSASLPPQQPVTKICPQCGKVVRSGDTFCPNCGKKL